MEKIKKVLIVATVQSHIAQFHKPLIKMLQDKGVVVDVAAFNNLKDKNELFLTEPDKIFDIPFVRSPLSPKNIFAYKALKKIIRNGGYDVIHCNTPVGGVVARLAAKGERRKGKLKVIYTSHGFHFYTGSPLKNWCLYYNAEKMMSRLTDIIITINSEDFQRAKEKFGYDKVRYVPGVGVDVERFKTSSLGKESVYKALDIPKEAKLILSVGELNKNKNHKVILEAIHKLSREDVFYAIAGNGPEKNNLLDKAEELNISHLFALLGYRRDIPDLLNACDMFVFPSKREGLSVALMEALSSGAPVIASRIRGNIDLVDDGFNGFLASPDSPEEFSVAMERVLSGESFNKSDAKREKLHAFSEKSVVSHLENIYDEVDKSLEKK